MSKSVYILFRRSLVSTSIDCPAMDWHSWNDLGDSFKVYSSLPAEPVAAETREKLEFIAQVQSPKEVAAIVRRDPTQKYVLFHGEMKNVEIAMPVFVDGKNLDTFEREGWGEGE